MMIDWKTEGLEEYFWKYCQGSPLLSEQEVNAFASGWAACIQHEKDQLAKSLAEFDNDDNDCGSGGCIL